MSGPARRAPGAATAASDVPDVLAPGLDVVFCGINPGFVSAAAAAHFANPRNDFWRLLHEAGFTPRLYAAGRAVRSADYGIGLTNAACGRPAAPATFAAPISRGPPSGSSGSRGS